MLVSDPKMLIGKNAPAAAMRIPKKNCRNHRRAPCGMQLDEERRNQSVARHGVKNARLPVHHDEQHRREPRNGAERDDDARPSESDIVDGKRDRKGDVELIEWHHAVENRDDDDVEERADHEARDDAER